MTITYRTIKGSELTYAEVDENFATITAQYDAVAAAVGDVGQSAANAANSAAEAAQSAIDSAASAGESAASALASASSADASANSASSALASQVAVTDLYDQFDDRYLGSKTAAPTLDNDGDAILTGALYWNSVSNKMFVWTGSMWADVVAANASTVQFSPTGGIAATNVQAAIAEVDSEAAKSASLAASGGAALVGFSPVGGISSGTVQAAIAEVDSEAAKSAALSASGGAALIGFSPVGTVSASTVQAAIAEVDSEKLAITTYESRAGSQGAISGDRNRVINGSCQIVNVSTVASVGGATPVYGGPEIFRASESASAGGQFTQSQGSLTWEGITLPTVRQTVNTAPTSIASSNYWGGIEVPFEGFNVFDLRGKAVAVSFVFNTNLSGTYSVALRDGALGYSYVTTITAVANTPMQVKIPASAIPTAASVPNTNALGLLLNVGFLNTASYQTSTLDSWQAADLASASGATNWGSTAGNFIELTNLQLEEGAVATPFIRRSYQHELALTQRYFESSGTAGLVFSGNVTSGSGYYSSGKYKVTKRAVPTVVVTVDAAVSFPNTPSTVLNSTIEGFRANSTANATGVGEKAESFTASARL